MYRCSRCRKVGDARCLFFFPGGLLQLPDCSIPKVSIHPVTIARLRSSQRFQLGSLFRAPSRLHKRTKVLCRESLPLYGTNMRPIRCQIHCTQAASCNSFLPINHHRRDCNDVNHNTLLLRLTSNASSALNIWRVQNLISKLLK